MPCFVTRFEKENFEGGGAILFARPQLGLVERLRSSDPFACRATNEQTRQICWGSLDRFAT
jgi:hypothetical protein